MKNNTTSTFSSHVAGPLARESHPSQPTRSFRPSHPAAELIAAAEASGFSIARFVNRAVEKHGIDILRDLVRETETNSRAAIERLKGKR